jgi:hypothetical protein
MDAGPAPAAERNKRKTEFEGAGGGGGDAVADPFGDDPFAPPATKKRPARPAGGGAAASAPAAKPKRVTKFDSGGRKDDPFAPVAQQTDEARFAGRRIIGWLITFDNHPDGRTWTIREGRNIIGREDACDVIVEDDMVSNAHAVLVWRGGKSRIDDKMSQNGTYLNEQDVMQPEPVSDGDVIRVGQTRMICRLLDSEQVAKVFAKDEG